MGKTTLRLADDTPEPTRAQIALAQIDQSHREWRSPWADVTGERWQAVELAREQRPTLDVDAVHRQQYRLVASSKVGRWRKIMRRLRGIQ